jgi:hypothetical protein
VSRLWHRHASFRRQKTKGPGIRRSQLSTENPQSFGKFYYAKVPSARDFILAARRVAAFGKSEYAATGD